MTAARMGKGAAKDELTPWIKDGSKPEIVGVYQRDLGFVAPYAQWDGTCWLAYMPDPQSAGKETAISQHQSEPWRGLASDPNGVTE